jgi:hypothetical protein
MQQKIVYVNRTGGHVAIIVRSGDMGWWDPRTGPNSTKGDTTRHGWMRY